MSSNVTAATGRSFSLHSSCKERISGIQPAFNAFTFCKHAGHHCESDPITVFKLFQFHKAPFTENSGNAIYLSETESRRTDLFVCERVVSKADIFRLEKINKLFNMESSDGC